MARWPIPCIVAASLAAHPALAAQLGTANAPMVPWGRIAFALLFCLTLAALAILALRHHRARLRLPRFGDRLPGLPPMPRRQIEVIETRRISQHGDVCLLQCRGRSYLIALGHGHALLLERQPLDGSDHGRPSHARPDHEPEGTP